MIHEIYDPKRQILASEANERKQSAKERKQSETRLFHNIFF